MVNMIAPVNVLIVLLMCFPVWSTTFFAAFSPLSITPEVAAPDKLLTAFVVVLENKLTRLAPPAYKPCPIFPKKPGVVGVTEVTPVPVGAAAAQAAEEDELNELDGAEKEEEDEEDDDELAAAEEADGDGNGGGVCIKSAAKVSVVTEVGFGEASEADADELG